MGETHGSSYDQKEIQRAPASHKIIFASILTLTALTAQATSELRKYHPRLANQTLWVLKSDEVGVLLRAPKPLCHHPPNRPQSLPGLRPFAEPTNSTLMDLLGVAVFACLTIALFSIARTDEFTVSNLTSSTHPSTPSGVHDHAAGSSRLRNH